MQDFDKDHGAEVPQEKDRVIILGNGERISESEWDELIQKIGKMCKPKRERL